MLAVAGIHVASFRDAYRGVLPDGFIVSLRVETSQRMWEGTYAKFPDNISVAQAPDGLVTGFCCSGPTVDIDKNEGYEFEIYGLHVRRDYRRRGIGACLLRAALLRARDQYGASSAIVWTLLGLPLSCKFYEREGGAIVKRGTWQLGRERIPEVAYGWSRLPVGGSGQ